jgi:hypothetical protein
MPLPKKYLRRFRRPIAKKIVCGNTERVWASDGLKLESEEGAAVCGLAGFADDHADSVDVGVECPVEFCEV